MSNIKQSPFLGLTGMGGGGTGLALGGAVAKKTYLDDIFSTYLTRGNETARSINTGVDMTEGGLVWSKSRSGNHSHFLFDTVRGANVLLRADSANANYTENTSLTSFNSNGFSLGTWVGVNENSGTNVHFSFRKQKSFFTIKEYSGSNSAQTLSHDLGCIPGLILIKRTDSSSAWMVYHTSLGSGKYAKLNTTVAGSSGSVWNSTSPTSSTFTVEGNNSNVNTSGGTFIAYLFAGAASTAATARSVGFDGNDYLSLTGHSDLGFDTGDFTWEAWVRPTSYTSDAPIYLIESGGFFIYKNGSDLKVRAKDGATFITTSNLPDTGVWTHIAVTRSGTTLRLFLNGILDKSATCSYDFGGNQGYIGVGEGSYWNGDISNLRSITGTALYTSSFIPPTEPLTNVTNTKLLCCNNSSVTGSTVTPDTIGTSGDPTASTDSPFSDPDGYKFGEDRKQQIIKCGSHTHNSTDPVRIYTGWEPQWLMFKNATQASNWAMYDVMRGIFIGSDGPSLAADSNTAENGVVGQGQIVIPHGDGFTIKYGLTAANPGNGDKIIYVAIRKSDGYTAPTPEAGTDVFTIDTGNGSSAGPCFDSNFAVDFALRKIPASSDDWWVVNRTTGKKYSITNSKVAESSHNDNPMDYNDGWGSGSIGSGMQSWMWKRGLGMDFVNFTGDGVQGRDVRHSLGVSPNMMWFKNRTRSLGGGADWIVYVSGITHLSVYGSDPDNFGNNPVALELNTTEKAQFSASGYWDHTHPNSTHFRVGDTYHTNQSGESIMAILFASIDKISKVGTFLGNGSSSDRSHELGFAPRFLIIKNVTDQSNTHWLIYDTVRGWYPNTSSDSKRLHINLSDAQATENIIQTTSTGFKTNSSSTWTNSNDDRFIYYAHA